MKCALFLQSDVGWPHRIASYPYQHTL